MADGFARVTGRPQAVVVHVDVGTQALGQGIHNASIGRVPIFIFAGLCPYTESGELPGSRTEYSKKLPVSFGSFLNCLVNTVSQWSRPGPNTPKI
jgi:hypothetical protein